MKSSSNSTIYNSPNVNSTLDLYYNTTDMVSIDISNITTKTQLTNLEKPNPTNVTDKKLFSIPTAIDSSLTNELTTPVNLLKMETTESINKNTEIPKPNMENSFTINSELMNTKSSIEKENNLKTDFNKKISTEIPISTKENNSNKKSTVKLDEKETLLKTELMKLITSSKISTNNYSTSKLTTKNLKIETENFESNTFDNKSLIKITESSISKGIETTKENSNSNKGNIIVENLNTLTTGKFTKKPEYINEKQTESSNLKETVIKEISKSTTDKFSISTTGTLTKKLENINEKQTESNNLKKTTMKEKLKYTTDESIISTNGKFTTKIKNENKNEIGKSISNSMKYSTKFLNKQTTGKSTNKPKRNETKKPIITIPTLQMNLKTSQPFKTTENKTTKFLNYNLNKNFSTRTPNFSYSKVINNASLKSDHSVTFIDSETTTEPNHTMGAGPLVIVVLLPFLALFLIAVVTALRRKMKKSRGRIVRVQSPDMGNISERDRSQMIPLTKTDNNDNN